MMIHDFCTYKNAGIANHKQNAFLGTSLIFLLTIVIYVSKSD